MLPCLLVCQRGKPLPSSEQECAVHCLPSLPAVSSLDPVVVKAQQLCSLPQARSHATKFVSLSLPREDQMGISLLPTATNSVPLEGHLWSLVMAVAAILLMPELAGEHRGCTVVCCAQTSSKTDLFLANMHPDAWVQCFPWTAMLLESWQAGTVALELQGYFGNVSEGSRHWTKFLGRFYSTCNLSLWYVSLWFHVSLVISIYLAKGSFGTDNRIFLDCWVPRKSGQVHWAHSGQLYCVYNWSANEAEHSARDTHCEEITFVFLSWKNTSFAEVASEMSLWWL